MDKFWPDIALLILILGLCTSASLAHAQAYVLRFSDAPSLQMHPQPNHQPFRLKSPAPTPDLPTQPAIDWLKRNEWKLVWPRLGLGKHQELLFGGPAEQRYLRLDAEGTFYIWTRAIQVDPKKRPVLEITWGMDQFPQKASLERYQHNDQPMALIISFGPKIPDDRFFPDVPRGLAYFWDETSTVGKNYTCIPAIDGPKDKKLQCIYPHIQYIALRNGEAGTRHTETVNLVDHFKKYFPDYWAQHQTVPPIVGVSIEVRSNETDTTSHARLYALSFTAPKPPESGETLDGN